MPDWIRITRFELLLVALAILAMAAIVQWPVIRGTSVDVPSGKQSPPR